LSKLGYLLKHLFLNARRLFETLLGLVFLMLAAFGAVESVSKWQSYLQSPSEGKVTFILYASFTVFLAILCLYSFLKARSIR